MSEMKDLLHHGETLYGWEPGVRYVLAEGMTRGQAKARIAWDEGEPFTDLRCRLVWLQYREITEADAEDAWLDEWYPGYTAWIGCKQSDVGATAWWEVRVPRA